MIYLLFDNCQEDADISFIVKKFDAPYKAMFSPKSSKRIIGWIKGAIAVLKQSKPQDVIVCWFDFQAVLCYWIAKFMFIKRNIVCLNILFKDKDTLKNKIVAMLYKPALNSKNVIASVTARDYGTHIKTHFNLKNELFLIHDVYHDNYDFASSEDIIPNSVFCGGGNGRDWAFLSEIAKKLPDVTFNFILRQESYDIFKDIFPANVNVMHDLPYEGFMKVMCQSQIVCMPLDTDAPAGLIALFLSAANNKPLITTDTLTTREYLSDNRGYIIKNSLDEYVSTIRYVFNNLDEATNKALKLKDFLRTECSEEMFIAGIKTLTKKFNNQ